MGRRRKVGLTSPGRFSRCRWMRARRRREIEEQAVVFPLCEPASVSELKLQILPGLMSQRYISPFTRDGFHEEACERTGNQSPRRGAVWPSGSRHDHASPGDSREHPVRYPAVAKAAERLFVGIPTRGSRALCHSLAFFFFVPP